MKLKYAFRGISTHVIYSLLLIAQLTFSFNILYDNINLTKVVSDDSNHVSKLFNSKMYTLNEMGFNDWHNSNMNAKNINTTLDYLESSKDFQYIENSCNAFSVEKFNNGDNFKMTSGETQLDNKSFIMVKNYTLNETFLKKYKLKLKAGRYFSDKEMKFGYGDNNVLPVIVGADYSKVFKIGDEFNYIREEGNVKKAKVIGIIENNEYITRQCASYRDKIYKYNNYIITTNALFGVTSTSRLMMCFNGNYLLFDKNASETKYSKENR